MTGAEQLWAGVGDVDITPPLGILLGGSFEERRGDRYERPLFAKALALRSGPTTMLLVSVDILMMRAVDIVDRAKELVTERTGVPGDHVMVSATHTHYGPPTMPHPGGPPVDPADLARVSEAIAQASVGAVTTMRPSRVGFGQAPVNGVCFNRRYHLANGLVQFNPGVGRDDVIAPAGPIDPTVTGLVVEDLAGVPFAFWANLALHYVDAETSTSISSDYFGAFGARMAGLLGTPVHAQLTNGCSGDINNIDLAQGVAERGKARAEMVASAVAGAAAAGAMMAARHATVELSSRLEMVELERAAVPTEDLRIADEVVAGSRADAPFSSVCGMPIPQNLAGYYGHRFRALSDVPQRTQVPVMIMTIGDLCIVGVPGEFFVEHGLRIRENSRFPATAVIGLANDHIGYVPTEQAHKEGSYETWRDVVSWTAPGSGEKVVDRVLSIIGTQH